MAQSNIRPHSNKVFVVMRAGCGRLDHEGWLQKAALRYAFKQVVQPGDRLIIIGIIDRIPTPLGWKNATIEDGFNGTNEITLARLKAQASNEFEEAFYRLSKLCDERQILLEFIIDSGKSCTEVLLHHAIELQPRCIILDRDLKGQKNSCARSLTCDVFLMKKDGRECKLVTSGTARHVHFENVDKVKIILRLFTRTRAV